MLHYPMLMIQLCCLFVYSSTTLSKVRFLSYEKQEWEQQYSDERITEPNSQNHYLNCAAWLTFLRAILVLWILFASCLSRRSKLTVPSLISEWRSCILEEIIYSHLKCFQCKALFLFWSPTVVLFYYPKHSQAYRRSNSIAHS